MSLQQDGQLELERHDSSRHPGSKSPGETSFPRQLHANATQQQYQQGTAPSLAKSGWLTSPTSTLSSSVLSNYEPASKCSFCSTLALELYDAQRVNRELSLKLASEEVELDTYRREVDACHSKIKTLEEELKILTESSLQLCLKHEKNAFQKLSSKLASNEFELEKHYDKCAFWHEILEEHEKSTGKSSNQEKLHSELDKKGSNFTKTPHITQQNEELLNIQQNLLLNDDKDSTTDTKVDDALSDTLNSSEASSSKHRNPTRRQLDHNRSPDNGSSKRNERLGPVLNQGQSTPSQKGPVENSAQENRSGFQGTCLGADGLHQRFNSVEIRPSRSQGINVPVGENANVSSAEGTVADLNVRRPYQSKPRNSENKPTSSQGSNSFPNLVEEIKCDLFAMSEEYALVHCVGSDLIMSSGVAVQFRKKFRNVPELLDQNKSPGQVAFLVTNTGQHIYYLVTKLTSTGKPKWEDFEKSVIEWSQLCVEHGVKKVAMPKIGCGRDHLDWSSVRNLLNKHFANKGIELAVCVIECESAPERKWSIQLRHSKDTLAMLDPRECALVFIASKDRFITDSIKRLTTKYGFLSHYCSENISLGSLYHYQNKALGVNLFGLVVKELHNEPISFIAIAKCLQLLKKAAKKSSLWYMGFEAFDDPKFPIVTRKLWTVIIDNFFTDDIEVYFCWPDDVTEKNWEESRPF